MRSGFGHLFLFLYASRSLSAPYSRRFFPTSNVAHIRWLGRGSPLRSPRRFPSDQGGDLELMSRLTDVIRDGRGGVFATSLPEHDLGDGLTQPGVVYLDECLVDLDEFPRPDRSSYCSISSSIWQELSRPNGKRFLVCLATPSRRAETVKNRCSSSCAENRRPPVFLLPISPKAPIGIDRTEFLDQARSSYRGVLALALAALAKRWALRRRHKTIPPMPAAIRIRAAASGRSSIGDHGDRPIAQTVKLLGVVVH